MRTCFYQYRIAKTVLQGEQSEEEEREGDIGRDGNQCHRIDRIEAERRRSGVRRTGKDGEDWLTRHL